MSRVLVSVLMLLALPMASLGQDDKPWTKPGAKAGDGIIGPDGGTMVWVPPGEFSMGSAEGNADERPVHQVRVTCGFWLGKYEVTNGQYARFLSAHGGSKDIQGRPMLELSDRQCGVERVGGRYVAKSNRSRHPAVGVTWPGAQAYSAHYGMRLPTEAEWEYAARGLNGWTYPWGDEWDSSKCCNYHNLGTGTPPTAEVGSISEGASWCGALDMAGNTGEWCSDWYDPRCYSSSPATDPPGPLVGERKVLRGGAWGYLPVNCRSARRFADLPVGARFVVGFRCVVPAE